MEKELFSSNLFNVCRLCLRTQVDMVDLFDTGIYNKITAVTSLKLNLDYGLPKNVCLQCKEQTEEIYRFICLVKSSEESLLHLKRGGNWSDPIIESSSKVEEQKEREEFFLIVVPEPEATPTDHTYPKERSELEREPKAKSDGKLYTCDRCQRPFDSISNFLNHFYECHFDEAETLPENFFSNCLFCGCYILNKSHYDKHFETHKNDGINIFKLKRVTCQSKTLKINLDGRKCKICEVILESERQFLYHFKESHRELFKEGERPEVVYQCPVCLHRLTNDRKGYLRHLSCHMKENLLFVKVAASGNPVPLRKSETVFLPTSAARKEIEKTESHVFTPEANFHIVEKNNYVCEFCSEAFETKAKVFRHLKEHLGKYVCDCCGKKFSSETRLRRHNKIHSDSEKCKICHRTFPEGRSLERHSAAHSDPNFLECEICRLPVPSASRLERHSETHRENRSTWECDVCGSAFFSKDGLACHRSRTGHVGDRKPLECNVCHEKFHVVKKFARHVKLHPRYKTSECSLCGKRLSTLQSLSLHMKRHFESDGILCPECGKRFFEERNYRRHLLTHKGIRPYLCDYQGCSKSFYTLFEVKRHKKYHFDTRDFPCPYCSKKFHESSHLKVHVRTHTGEKPYVCPHCRKGFVTRTRCKQHIKLIHQGVGYDLIVSDITKKVPVFETVQSTS